MPEEWRDIPGYEGRYRVSSIGRIRGPSGKILHPWFNKGYPYFHLGAGRKRLVAWAVLAAFVGPRPEDQVIRHLNGDRSDSRVENLAYGTQQENCQDTAMYCGINTQRLSPSDVAEIKNRRRNGESRRALAKEYQVDESTIWRAVTGRTFARLLEEAV